MTALKVIVDNKQNALILLKMLKSMSFVKKVEPDSLIEKTVDQFSELEKILHSVEPGSLFSDIKDPALWQKEIRDEWDAY